MSGFKSSAMGGFNLSSTTVPNCAGAPDGLQPQYGMNFTDLISYINSSPNNRIMLDPMQWIFANRKLRKTEIGLVFNNAPLSVQFIIFPKTQVNNLLTDLARGLVQTYTKFSAGCNFPTVVVPFTQDYSIKVAGMEVYDDKSTSPVKASKSQPLDPLRPPNFTVELEYDLQGNFQGPKLEPCGHTPGAPGQLTITNHRPSVELHITLYRGCTAIGQYIMPPVGLTSAHIIPYGFTLVAVESNSAGEVVGEISRCDFAPGVAAFLVQNGVTNSKIALYKLYTVPIQLVLADPDDQQIKNDLMISGQINGYVAPGVTATLSA